MIGALSVLLGGMIIPTLPDDCNLPGWTFCINLPDDASARIETNGPDFIVYAFEADDGSALHVYVGWAPSVEANADWEWGRLGHSQARWITDDTGRTDYLVNRPWQGPVPNWIHAWTMPSDTDAVTGAASLVSSLESCPLIMCPDPGPEPAVPERIERPESPFPIPARH